MTFTIMAIPEPSMINRQSAIDNTTRPSRMVGSEAVDGVVGCMGVEGCDTKLSMNKKEAAEFLNLSTRAVERAVSKGKLGVRYKKHKHGHVALFNPGELRRYKSGLEVPLPRRPFVEPVTPTTPTSPDKQSPLTIGSVMTLSDSLNERTGGGSVVPLADKLTLSLSEASSLSGLSQRFLLQSIRKDKLKAFKHEKDWRIKRADLDSFVKEL